MQSSRRFVIPGSSTDMIWINEAVKLDIDMTENDNNLQNMLPWLLSILSSAWSDIYYHPVLPSDADIDYPEMMGECWIIIIIFTSIFTTKYN